MDEAHALTREQGDPWSIAFALSVLGNLVLLRGELARAETLEREVALLIAQGQTNRQIAEALVIAEWTVDTHVRHILNNWASGRVPRSPPGRPSRGWRPWAHPDPAL